MNLRQPFSKIDSSSATLLETSRHLTEARHCFRLRFGEYAAAQYLSPGRVNLIGEHTDYTGGLVLPAALDLSHGFTVGQSELQQIRVVSKCLNKAVTISLTELRELKPQTDWQDYFVGVLRELSLMPELSPRLRGLNVLVSGNLPIGAGLSSSASITTGFAFLLNDQFDLGLSLQEVALLAQRAEKNFVGVECGILDPFAVALSRQERVLALDCASQRFEHIRFPADVSLVVVNTKVPRNLSASPFNLRVEECESASRIVNKLLGKPMLGAVQTSELPALECSAEFRAQPNLFRRVRHIVEENQRVAQFVAALQRSDLERLGTLLIESHESLRDLFEVSCAELDFLVEQSMALPGVLGAKMTGAGFGGCAVVLMQNTHLGDYQEAVSQSYESTFGYPPDCYSSRPASGVAKLG